MLRSSDWVYFHVYETASLLNTPTQSLQADRSHVDKKNIVLFY